MLEIDLLRSFVSVIDAGGFTRAGERVHRTQSTVSQQIKRLEDAVGRPLLTRDGKRAKPTDEGERLLSYARRILALEQEARDVVARPVADGVVRLGLPEDFAAYRLPELLYDFKRARPTLRLDVRCGLSASLQRALEAGELDLALVKRQAGLPGAIAAWPERLHWVTSRAHPIDLRQDPVPLAVAEQGCLYRNQVIHALESAGRSWHIAYTSPNLHGIQAAVSAGLGISILSELGILADHRVIDASDGFPPPMKTELALVAGNNQSPAAKRLAELLVDFCGSIRTRGKAAAVA
ncbi:MAG TPA: LysR substrate-binding domain-containing protein [Pseudorhodoplanes sp.]|jgi:DNA-binding transcriptional LysR family regulator|nr:LysR substrate-binding domain-containing protein [Pseudorhodoplanes sp.]